MRDVLNEVCGTLDEMFFRVGFGCAMTSLMLMAAHHWRYV
jgi:hypothetical protein